VSVASAIVSQLSHLHRRGLRGVGRLMRVAARWTPELQRVRAVTVDGRVLYLDLRDETCLTYALLGQIPTDRFETEIVRSTIRPGEAAVDVGAFVGWYSTLLAQSVGPAGAVYAFEPNPTSYSLLKRAAASYPQLEVLNAAVGKETTTAALYVPSHLHSTSLRPTSGGDRRASCDVVSLDDFLRDGRRRPPVFVKVDAEGAEADILRGATALLDRHPAVWMVEICSDTAARFGLPAHNVVELFRARGYCGYRIKYPSGSLLPIDQDPLDGIFNAVFFPSSLEERMRPWLSAERA